MRCALVRLTLVGLAATAITFAQSPENVFIIVIDGLRHDEGWAQGAANLPHIWNDLKPQGTFHARFWARGWTATTGGHLTILSGVRQIIRNNSGNEQEIRSLDPLAFEYYRQHFAISDTTVCGTVIGKVGNVGAVADYSLEPALGPPWQGFVRGDASTHDDTASVRLLHRTMDSLHPRLVLLNMADVDTKGHTGIYSDYLTAIRVADSLIYDIWRHIQAEGPYSDTFYRNRTVLLVTSDHGRNDDAHGGFAGHGEWDHGSRQLGLLALGPGIARNRIVTETSADQIDILPTVGALLGFPVPFAEGRVMTELFATGYTPGAVIPRRQPVFNAVNLSNTPGFSRDPDIARDRNGNIYLVWSDNSTGNWQVLFRRSTDNGTTWSSNRTLFDYPAAESTMWYARVAADDSLAVAAIGYGRHLARTDTANPLVTDTTFIWYPWLATSTDAGGNWSYSSLIDSNTGSYCAPVTVRNGRVGLAWLTVGQFPWQNPRNGIFFNNRMPGGAWRGTPVEPTGRQCLHLALQDDGSVYHIGAAAWDDGDFDVAYCRSTDRGETWSTTWVVRDPAGSAHYDYDPELVTDPSGMVHLFWARKPNLNGVWQVMYGRRDPLTGIWDTVRLTSSPGGAWQPHAAIKGDTIVLVWIDYRDGNPEVYAQYSFDRGAGWSTAERVTWTDALTHHPRVMPTPRGFYCVWQDNSSGNWEVYGRELVAGPTCEAAVARIIAPSGSLDSLAPVVPRAVFKNLSSLAVRLSVYCTMRDEPGTIVYSDSGEVTTIGPGDSISYLFSAWPRPHLPGSYTVRCSLYLAGDSNPDNNSLENAFTVTVPTPGWSELASMPLAPSGRYSRDGAWLVADEGLGLLFAAKGSRTADFYGYNLLTGEWQELPPIPAGPSGRAIYRGAAACSDGNGTVYATRGNNTIEFQRYRHNQGWVDLADVPPGVYGKKIKGGTDLVYVPGSGDHVYLLKGCRNEFLRYSVAADSWQLLPDAPVGTNQRWDKGSWLSFDGNHTIYAHKARYHEFFAFDLNTLAWRSPPLTPMPVHSYTGRTRKVKDGSSAVWLDGAIYAFKGANTQEFWCYHPTGDSWVELETIPGIGWSGRRKRVKGGADIVASGSLLIALKGNRSNELWRYVRTVTAVPLTRGTAVSDRVTRNDGAGRTGTRPATISSTPMTFYDAAGRIVATGHLTPDGRIDTGPLRAGVYIGLPTAPGSPAIKKIVIRH